jgi:hypothetical protein
MTLRRQQVTFALLLISLLLGSLLDAAFAQKPRKSMSKSEVVELLQNGVSSTRVEELVRAYGIAFEMTPEVVMELRDAGAREDLIKALREIASKPEAAAPVGKPESSAASPASAAPAPAPAPPPVLMIETTPPGVEVYIDEERAGKTSSEGKLKVSTLSAGSHSVRVSSSGYDDFSRSVDLAGGQATVLAVTLVAAKPVAPEPAPTAPQPANKPATGASPPENQPPADFYKAMMSAVTGQTGEGQGDPNVKRFYVMHQHGGGGMRSLGYGGGMCSGWLMIGNGHIQFSSNDEDHAFDAPAGDVSELQVKSNHIRFRVKGKNYHLMTQEMGMFGGDGQSPGSLRKAFEAVGVKPK